MILCFYSSNVESFFSSQKVKPIKNSSFCRCPQQSPWCSNFSQSGIKWCACLFCWHN